ncbi:MAG: methyltransferase, partial [Candidatus Omnitrophota bacterium]
MNGFIPGSSVSSSAIPIESEPVNNHPFGASSPNPMGMPSMPMPSMPVSPHKPLPLPVSSPATGGGLIFSQLRSLFDRAGEVFCPSALAAESIQQAEIEAVSSDNLEETLASSGVHAGPTTVGNFAMSPCEVVQNIQGGEKREFIVYRLSFIEEAQSVSNSSLENYKSSIDAKSVSSGERNGERASSAGSSEAGYGRGVSSKGSGEVGNEGGAYRKNDLDSTKNNKQPAKPATGSDRSGNDKDLPVGNTARGAGSNGTGSRNSNSGSSSALGGKKIELRIPEFLRSLLDRLYTFIGRNPNNLPHAISPPSFVYRIAHSVYRFIAGLNQAKEILTLIQSIPSKISSIITFLYKIVSLIWEAVPLYILFLTTLCFSLLTISSNLTYQKLYIMSAIIMVFIDFKWINKIIKRTSCEDSSNVISFKSKLRYAGIANGLSNGVLWVVLVPGLIAFIGMAAPDSLKDVLDKGISGIINGALLVPIAAAIGFTNLYLYNILDKNKDTQEVTEKLLTNGPFSFTRNPTYLSYRIFALWMISVALQAHSYQSLIVPVLLWVITDIQASIEEHYLKLSYGDSYRDYMQKVPRWIRITKKTSSSINSSLPSLSKEMVKIDEREKPNLPKSKEGENPWLVVSSSGNDGVSSAVVEASSKFQEKPKNYFGKSDVEVRKIDSASYFNASSGVAPPSLSAIPPTPRLRRTGSFQLSAFSKHNPSLPIYNTITEKIKLFFFPIGIKKIGDDLTKPSLIERLRVRSIKDYLKGVASKAVNRLPKSSLTTLIPVSILSSLLFIWASLPFTLRISSLVPDILIFNIVIPSVFFATIPIVLFNLSSTLSNFSPNTLNWLLKSSTIVPTWLAVNVGFGSVNLGFLESFAITTVMLMQIYFPVKNNFTSPLYNTIKPLSGATVAALGVAFPISDIFKGPDPVASQHDSGALGNNFTNERTTKYENVAGGPSVASPLQGASPAISKKIASSSVQMEKVDRAEKLIKLLSQQYYDNRKEHGLTIENIYPDKPWEVERLEKIIENSVEKFRGYLIEQGKSKEDALMTAKGIALKDAMKDDDYYRAKKRIKKGIDSIKKGSKSIEVFADEISKELKNGISSEEIALELNGIIESSKNDSLANEITPMFKKIREGQEREGNKIDEIREGIFELRKEIFEQVKKLREEIFEQMKRIKERIDELGEKVKWVVKETKELGGKVGELFKRIEILERTTKENEGKIESARNRAENARKTAENAGKTAQEAGKTAQEAGKTAQEVKKIAAKNEMAKKWYDRLWGERKRENCFRGFTPEIMKVDLDRKQKEIEESGRIWTPTVAIDAYNELAEKYGESKLKYFAVTPQRFEELIAKGVPINVIEIKDENNLHYTGVLELGRDKEGAFVECGQTNVETAKGKVYIDKLLTSDGKIIVIVTEEYESKFSEEENLSRKEFELAEAGRKLTGPGGSIGPSGDGGGGSTGPSGDGGGGGSVVGGGSTGPSGDGGGGVTGDKTGVTGDKTGVTGDKTGVTGDKTGVTGDKTGVTGDKTGVT